jgi:hypothetical protein
MGDLSVIIPASDRASSQEIVSISREMDTRTMAIIRDGIKEYRSRHHKIVIEYRDDEKTLSLKDVLEMALAEWQQFANPG